jgi:hypothetical protein
MDTSVRSRASRKKAPLVLFVEEPTRIVIGCLQRLRIGVQQEERPGPFGREMLAMRIYDIHLVLHLLQYQDKYEFD